MELLNLKKDIRPVNTRMGRKTIISALPFVPQIPQQSSTLSEEKASRVLGVVFSAFVICWAPFFIMNLLAVFCHDVTCTLHTFLGDMALWLGYSSSTINPLIYTVFNIKFRRSFKRLLLCQSSSHSFAFRTSNTNSTTSLWSPAGATSDSSVCLSLAKQQIANYVNQDFRENLKFAFHVT